MFTAKQTKNLKEQLYEIYDELSLNFKETDQELWWPTPSYINPEEYEFRESYDLFNGNCGIVLFLLKLYQFDGNVDHLRMVNKAMWRILNAEQVLNPKFFALYTGLGGVVYTCLKIFEVTNDRFYKDKALALTLNNEKQLTGLLKTDLLSGYTGNLLMMTLLYHHTNHPKVLNMVKVLVDRLIVEARISEQGLKWDCSRSKKAYDSMTGFSHGASGIAWALMQVGQYFNASGLIYLAEQALAYEMQYFHRTVKNWLDLRLGPHRLNKPDVHKWRLETFLPEMTNVNSWAHGAAGIGLSRHMALQISHDGKYAKDCQNVLERCLCDLEKLDRADFTLVSGYCGMIPFLLNYRMKTPIVSILEHAGNFYRKTNSYNTYVSCGVDDYGLLSGKVGVGYAILYTLSGAGSDSIMTPKMPKNKRKSVLENHYGEINVKKSIFSRYYVRTLAKLRGFSAFEGNEIEDFRIKLQLEISNTQNSEAAAAFDLENQLVALWKEHKGYFSFKQKHMHSRKKFEESLQLSDQDLIEQFLSLNERVKLYRPDSRKENKIHLLVSEGNEIKELQVGVLASIILIAIEKGETKGVDFVKSLQSMLFGESPTEKVLAELEAKVLKQIRLLIEVGFVEIAGY